MSRLADAIDGGAIFVVAVFVTAFVVGGVLGFKMGKDEAGQFNEREALRAECIGGNQLACRVYEIDHSRGQDVFR